MYIKPVEPYFFSHEITPLKLASSEHPILEILIFKADHSVPTADISQSLEDISVAIRKGGFKASYSISSTDDHLASLIVPTLFCSGYERDINVKLS